MEGATTDSLGALAPKWSLAGDDQLLSLLQSTHQKIVSKCQEVNSKIEEMTSALDDASINLQNVNNKFMALSNSQFIESRVYDDDADLATEPQPVKDKPQPPPIDELSLLKKSVLVLERAHETAEIMDDSDSDSDAEISVVMRPRDMYAHRPLPYIIGTPQWKNKWHAGLVVEDSDSDSSASRRVSRDAELYSESASEAEETPPPAMDQRTISESDSSLSERVVEHTPPALRQKPSDIAAELARRLGGAAQPQVLPETEEYSPPVPTTRKVYAPEKPATSTVFSDEPPPLDTYEAEEPQSSDDDIFAEINRKKPYAQRNTAPNNLAEDLFSFDKPSVDEGDIFSDFAPGNVETKPAKLKSPLFEDESEPELFVEPAPQRKISQSSNIQPKQEEISTKKPVGGISLFGSNKDAENIGAAILKRNQRKSSTSGEESGSDDVQKQRIEEKLKNTPKNTEIPNAVAKSKTTDEIDNKPLPKKEKDIFDDLFSKPEKESKKKPPQKIVKEPVKEKEKTNVKDLFSDNIFDDIDDIFTSNVKMPPKESNQKSIFDDDDLFTDIVKPVSKNEPTSSKNSQKEVSKNSQKVVSKDTKSIFDSDDDLFSDVITVTKSKKDINPEINVPSNTDQNQETISKEHTVKPTESTKERNLFDDSPQIVKKPEIKPQMKLKSIFDSDSDDDIFASITKTDTKKSNNTEKVLNSNVDNNKPIDSEENFNPDGNLKPSTQNIKEQEPAKAYKSPSLFEEDEIDDLFVNANKLSKDSDVPKEIKIAEVKTIPPAIKETFINDINTGNETNNLPKVDHTEHNNLPKSMNEIKQSVPDKPSNIFDDNLAEDDIFSSSKDIQKVTPNRIISEEIITTGVIESSQDVSESVAEETKSASEEIVIVKSQVEDIKTPEVENSNIVTESQKYEELDANRSVFDDFIDPIKEKEVLATNQKKPISSEPNVFDDIFTEPPAFEKPVEPKKSKNVNALFDDDSDDESLFFKKNDVISDEKPEIFTQNANFGIFVDEPPSIDVDFTTKPAKNKDVDNNDDDLFGSLTKVEENVPKTAKKLDIGENDGDLFSSVPKTQEIVPTDIKERDTKIETPKTSHETKPEDIFAEEEDKNMFKKPEVNKRVSSDAAKIKDTITDTFGKVSDSDDDLFSSLATPNVPDSSQKDKPFEQKKTLKTNVDEKSETNDEFDNIFASKESPAKDTDAKKIGKLNTKNFNINVNALIPGASPKKVPKELKNEQIIPESENIPEISPNSDETDNYQPKPLSNKVENEEKDTNAKEPVVAKPFGENIESGVLDNNFSKQRPRIQVKRRPSSRRARHEAVRKSAIDFADDTDNSSSFDEPVKSKNLNKEKLQNDSTQKDAQIANQIQDSITNETDNAANNETVKPNIEKGESNIQNAETYNKILNEPAVSSEVKTETKNIPQNAEQKQGSTTKIVYILNDEDIFNTGPKNVKSKDKENKNESDDDIFKSIGVKTLGKTYKENTEVVKKDDNTANIAKNINKNDENNIIKEVKSSKITKSSLFDDSDEELFSEKKKIVKKTTIFDSDSEEDLFSGKKRTEKQNKEQKNKEVKQRTEVKGSLFGDDDDDDLFGVKKEKVDLKQAPVPSTSKEAAGSIASKPAKSVFDDPLSMLDDD